MDENFDNLEEYPIVDDFSPSDEWESWAFERAEYEATKKILEEKGEI